ncbi:RNA/RNP complex-1-interacting phosphatase [Indicator indicator]|uniref:RNA/RNP complex-1-interacting phosphatase n=1 Tax=Indicator indicator TaxID=1002788 RepID=UPI0023DEF791|nr:RNA/RNP complex-1-interacting phosphatase [Indicator indicator]
MVGKSRVPERWTNYLPLGRRMPGTRFIAFKVPLKKSFDQKLPPEDRFSPCDLLKKIKEQKEELGLIIDLTYTTRYYRPEELPATLCYSKILTMGHEIPNKQTIYQFKYVVKKFLEDNKDNDKLIGVHCTHGLNRTGYLVCRYLIDVEGMEPNAAIELFNRSRGHPIERTNYIQDLRKRAVQKNCGVKSFSSGSFKDKSSAAANTKKQITKHHPHHSNQHPLAVPRLFPAQEEWQRKSECRSSSSARKSRRRGPKVQAQPQELAAGSAAQRQPCALAARNSQLTLPGEELRKGLCFSTQTPQFYPPQKSPAARKRKRRRKKPAETA